MANDLGGVWRTVGGRRIFIKDGQDLESAMRESGKFANKKEERALKYYELRDIASEIEKKLYSKTTKEEEKQKIYEELKKVKDKYKKLKEDLSEEDLKKARDTIKNKNKIIIDHSNDDKIYDKIINDTDEKLKIELENELSNIEKYEDDYGIDQQFLDELNTKTMAEIKNMYDNEEINDYIYEKYIDKTNEHIGDIMAKKGYEIYEHQGEIYYSMLPKAKKAYNNIIEELDKRNVKYKISRSWNPGELPSIYVEDDDGNQFRIANHFNSKNQQFEAYSLEENKIYSTKDYINYKETVLKDLDKFLN